MKFNIGSEAVAVYLSLIVLINRIVEGFFTPIFDKLEADKTYLMYVSWLVGAAIIFATGLNLFMEIIINPTVGQVLTAIAVGGGANILYDVTSS